MLVLLLLSRLPLVLWPNVTSGGVFFPVDMGDLNGDGIGEVALAVNNNESVLPHDLGSGCYLVRFGSDQAQGSELEKMTVIE